MYASKKLVDKLIKGGWKGEKKLDILNDLCVKYAKEMFGESGYYSDNKFTGIKTMREASERVEEFGKKGLWHRSYKEIAQVIFELIQENKQNEAEDYIIKNCKFNKNN